MMLAGDELSNSRDGNNNTYCQDNEISWVNWPEEDAIQVMPEMQVNVDSVVVFFHEDASK